MREEKPPTVLETAVEMGYTKLRRYKENQKKLCIFIENLEYTQPHHFGYEIIMGFRQLAEPAGYQVDLLPVDENLQRSIPYDMFMLQHDYVGADNNEGMELAVSQLKQLGHKKIGYLSGALGSHIMQIRHKAFFHAMHQNGLKTDFSYADISYYITHCLEKHLPRLLDMGMTAIICAHDILATSVMIQCHQMGLRVPEDIDALDSLMNHVSIRTMLLHTRLILRDSTGPAAS